MDPGLHMDPALLAARLQEAAERLGIEVREGPADSDGAVVTLRGKKAVFVPRGALASVRAEAIARALAAENLEEVFLMPVVREAVERARSTREE